MAVHIPIGELALELTIKMQGAEYWVCVDERRYDHNDRPYYCYTIYRDGEIISDDDWKHPSIEQASGMAAEEIVERWMDRA